MKRILLASLLAAAASSANATVLTFDDIAGASQNGYNIMPVYKGFIFNTNTSHWIDTVGSSYNYGAHSGDFTLLNNYGGAINVSAADGSDFSFDGVWAETWGRVGARNGTIRGFNNGMQVWSTNVALTSSFQYFGAMKGKIDRLELDLGSWFLADDLALNEAAAAAVPEPGSLALLGLGLAGFAAARRRKQA